MHITTVKIEIPSFNELNRASIMKSYPSPDTQAVLELIYSNKPNELNNYFELIILKDENKINTHIEVFMALENKKLIGNLDIEYLSFIEPYGIEGRLYIGYKLINKE